MVVFVSAFIISDVGHRRPDEYFAYFDILAKSGVEILLFLDKKLKSSKYDSKIIQEYPNVKIVEYISLDTSWYPFDPSSIIFPANRNNIKDNLHFLTIQLMKMKLLCDTVNKYTSSEYLAWIDFSIFHIINNISLAYQRLRDISTTKFITTHIIAPSPNTTVDITDLFNKPIWYFAGGFFIGHRSLFESAYINQMLLVKNNIPKITWEINYWFMMRDKFKIYYGDHNDTIFSLPISEFKENILKI